MSWRLSLKVLSWSFFGEQIKKVIVDTLDELKIKTIKVTCNDKGALDYTIKSRLVTAIKRMEG